MSDSSSKKAAADAIKKHQKLLGYDPVNAFSWCQLDGAHWYVGGSSSENVEPCIAAAAKCVDLDPTCVDVYALLVAGLVANGQPEIALPLIKEGLAIEPDCDELHGLLRGILFEKGKAKEGAIGGTPEKDTTPPRFLGGFESLGRGPVLESTTSPAEIQEVVSQRRFFTMLRKLWLAVPSRSTVSDYATVLQNISEGVASILSLCNQSKRGLQPTASIQ